MDDAKRAEAANRKLLHGTKPTVVRPDPTTPIAQRLGGRTKRQEPPCPINVKGPKLGDIINDWLTFIRQEVDEQQKVTKAVESTDRQPGKSEEDVDGVLVCIYDRQCKICYNQNRPRTNICSQPASSCYNVGNNMDFTSWNCFVPSNNCNKPCNNYSKPWPSDSFSDLSTFTCSSQSSTGYEQRNISFRHPNVCHDSQLQASSNQLHVSNNQFEASNTKHMFQTSKCMLQTTK
ncbi:uncharacterized protein LOC110443795 [Mizuhopecten yessoensis]|uniref:Uncharacterized protein n=1 Tax=Mizuhopecten yessoensis TaxID=6573 RepID=A0A210PE49_MIZYE|nr:uncharacterized protein LOC110443795 [Mizuhopecten yessoensis]OWF34762.1 hypothetical protein KP79_PYT14160 [Mizuhopecten yessoensis]